MPSASGAVAAGAVADRMIGPKENQKLAIVMVKFPCLMIIQYVMTIV